MWGNTVTIDNVLKKKTIKLNSQKIKSIKKLFKKKKQKRRRYCWKKNKKK
jgi:hypothetical protein